MIAACGSGTNILVHVRKVPFGHKVRDRLGNVGSEIIRERIVVAEFPRCRR